MDLLMSFVKGGLSLTYINENTPDRNKYLQGTQNTVPTIEMLMNFQRLHCRASMLTKENNFDFIAM